jgi:hypothetical protein
VHLVTIMPTASLVGKRHDAHATVFCCAGTPLAQQVVLKRMHMRHLGRWTGDMGGDR